MIGCPLLLVLGEYPCCSFNRRTFSRMFGGASRNLNQYLDKEAMKSKGWNQKWRFSGHVNKKWFLPGLPACESCCEHAGCTNPNTCCLHRVQNYIPSLLSPSDPTCKWEQIIMSRRAVNSVVLDNLLNCTLNLSQMLKYQAQILSPDFATRV